MKNINKELLSLVLIIASGLIIFVVLGIVAYGFDRLIKIKYSYLYFLTYILLCIFSFIISGRVKNKIIRFVHNIIIFPLTFLFGFIMVVTPYIVLQIHFFLYLLMSAFIPLIFFIFDKFTNLFELNTSTHIYIIVTLSVITATLLNKQVKYLTYLFSPFRIYSSQKLKKFEFKKLTDYLLSESNIKFIIYLLYFIYLLIVNLFNFQENSFYSSPLIDKAVLQSFITFIALERLIANLKDLDFKPSELIKKLLTSMTGNEIEEKNRE